MPEQPDNLVLIILGRMDEKLDRVIEDLHDFKVRLTGVEEGVNVVQRRIERLDRVERIEKRLDIAGVES